MVNLLRGIFGVCVANSLMFAAIIGILTARREKKAPPKDGGLNVTRRGGRTYVTVTLDEVPLTEPWNPAAFDRARADADNAGGEEG